MKFNGYLLTRVLTFFCFPFMLVAQNNDCTTAIHLCSKSALTISKLEGYGVNNNEVTGLPCLPEGLFETNSVWLKWNIGKSGDLGFIITPDKLEDDIDFVLYRLPNESSNCEDKEIIRCMASGENLESAYSEWGKCLGITGLRKSDLDAKEEEGCAQNDNNFLSDVDVIQGETYLLVVNNYKSSSGFNISFTGTTEFEYNPLIISDMKNIESQGYFQGDTILLIDNSTENGIEEESRIWDFGADAYFSSREGKGPHLVWYSSSGNKQIIQKVTTTNGCLLTGKYELKINDDQLVNKAEGGIFIYPNPANNVINVRLSLKEEDLKSFTIKDEVGRIVLTYQLDEVDTKVPIKLDLKNLVAGVYFICVELENELIKKKFVKI